MNNDVNKIREFNYPVSVIIPVYNAEKYLQECIENILYSKVDNRDVEIIVVNDGSTDSSLEILSYYSEKYAQVKLVNQANRGASEARRIGVKHSTGEYVVFLDSDDWLSDNALQQMFDRCKMNKLDFLECTFVKYITPRKSYTTMHKYEGIFSGDEFWDIVFDVNEEIAITSAMSKKELWTDDIFLPQSERLPNEDLFPMYSICKKIEKAEITNDMPIYHYRYNPNSATHTCVLLKRQDLWKRYFEILRKQVYHICGDDTRFEHKIRMLEVNRLAFNVSEYNTTDDWYRDVLSYESSSFDQKHKILLWLLRMPSLCQFFVKSNRYIKSVLSKVMK